jgi:hypothetical protein
MPVYLVLYTFPTPFAEINPQNFQTQNPPGIPCVSAMKQFAENEGGIYRITSNWRTSDSYIYRVGKLNAQGYYDPSDMAQLFQLDKEWYRVV